MDTRSKLLAAALAIVAIVAGHALLGRSLSPSAADVDASCTATLDDAHVGGDGTGATIEPPEIRTSSRTALSPEALGPTSDVLLAPELFLNCISGHVRVAGGRPGSAAHARVRCTPSIGAAVDGIVDEHDRFEVRGFASGAVVLTCTHAGYWAAETKLVVDETQPTTEVEILLQPVRVVRIWIDDFAGSAIPSDGEHPSLVQRLEATLTTSPQTPGQILDRDLSSRSETWSKPSATWMPRTESELASPASPTPPEPWRTLEFVEFHSPCLALSLQGTVIDSLRIRAGASDVHVRFDPRILSTRFTDLDVQVEEEATGARFANVTVWVGEMGLKNSWIGATTRSDGIARVPYLCLGDYVVRAEDSDSLPNETRVDVKTGIGATNARIVLTRGVRIEGRVEWASAGAEAQSAQVSCTAVSEDTGGAVLPRRSVWTRDRFEFRGLARGRYRLSVLVNSDRADVRVIEVDTRAGSVSGIVWKAP